MCHGTSTLHLDRAPNAFVDAPGAPPSARSHDGPFEGLDYFAAVTANPVAASIGCLQTHPCNLLWYESVWTRRIDPTRDTFAGQKCNPVYAGTHPRPIGAARPAGCRRKRFAGML